MILSTGYNVIAKYISIKCKSLYTTMRIRDNMKTQCMSVVRLAMDIKGVHIF